MSFVRRLRVNDQVVDNVYEKITSDGDSANFSAEADGKRALVRFADSTFDLTSNGKDIIIDLPFTYLLNRNQLEVYWNITVPGADPLFYLGFTRLLSRSTAEMSPSFDFDREVYYEEVTSSQIRVRNVNNLNPRPVNNSSFTQPGPGFTNSFLLSIPHTSLPATRDNKVIVENQGNNQAVELLGRGDGVVFTTVSGKKILVRPDDGGGLTTNEL